MSENGENINSSSLDNNLNKHTIPDAAPPEKYEASGQFGQVVADKPSPPSQNEPTKLTSWTMREIEREIANTTLRPSRTKVDAFSVRLHQKSDFRMKTLSRQFGLQLKRDHRREMETGPVENRVREFDIQSQTLRSVIANAAMGSYQFQKNMTLPYMRKNLALGYQKVALLKEISGGISSMEKSIVTKLEAIKINTAGAVPRKMGYFKKLFEDVGFLNRRRVAQNISNYVMDGNDELYRRFVSPKTKKLKEMMLDTSESGGVNALKRNVSGKLNRLRRSVRNVAEENIENPTLMQSFKKGIARKTQGVLNVSVRKLAKSRLGEERNRSLSELLQKPTRDLARFNPFAKPGDSAYDPEGEDLTGRGAMGGSNNSSLSDKLLLSFNDWRKEYRKDQETALDKLTKISEKIACCCEDTGIPVSPKRTGRKKTSTKTKSDKSASAEDMTLEPIVDVPDVKETVTPQKSRGFFTNLRNFISPKTDSREKVPVSDNVAPDVSRSLSPDREMGGKVSLESIKPDGNVTSTLGSITSPFATKPLGDNGVDLKPTTPQSFSSHVDMFNLQRSTNTLLKQADDDRAFVKRMFDNLGEKVTSVSETVSEGNQQRSRFEKIQAKWKEMADRLANRKTRKNSYEDMQEKKEKEKDRKGLLSRLGDRAKGLATGVGANLADGNVVGAAASAGGQLLDWAKDTASDAAGDFINEKADGLADKAKTKGSRAWRKAKIMRSARGRRLARSIGRSATSTAVTAATEGVIQQGAKRGLLKGAGSLMAAGAKGAGGLALKGLGGTASLAGGLALSGGKSGLSLLGRGAGAVGKATLSGGWKLAKGVGPGLAVGLAADAAGDWIGKNTTGATKRLGQTAATAASWGATGAGLGSVIPVIGTMTGGAIGAAAGALYENADLVRKAMAYITNKQFDIMEGVGKAGVFMWKNIFGSDAKIDKLGRVTEKETPSIFGHVKTLLFGRDAKYAKSGDLITEGKVSIFSDLRRGFDLFFFGVKDPKEKNKFKPESSMLAQLTKSLMDTFDSFKKSISDLAKGISDGAGNLYDKAVNVGSNIVNGVADYWNGDPSTNPTGKDVYKGKGTPVPDAAAIVKALLPQAVITSHRRRAGQAGNAGNDSWHVKSGAAVDIAPIPGMTFEQFQKTFTNAGYSLIEAIDETNPATMKKTGATGPHWHLVLGNYEKPGGSSAYAMGTNNPKTQAPGKGSMIMQSGKSNPYAWDNSLSNPSMPSNPSAPNYAGGTGAGGVAPAGKDAKSLFNSTVNYLSSRKGYSKVAAIGIAANLYGESNLNPTAFNSAGGGRGAKGIAQWRGSRISEIEQRWGKSIHQMNLQEQLDAVDMELREGRHVTNSKSIREGNTPIMDALNKAPNPQAVIQQMVHRYERPSESISGLEAETRRRIQVAQSLMGGMGTDIPKAPEKKQASPLQNAPAPKPKAAAVPAPKPQQTKAPSKPAPESNSLLATAEKALSAIGDYFTGDDAKSKSNSKGNTVIAPVTVATKAPVWPTTAQPTMMSMAKTSVRTGN